MSVITESLPEGVPRPVLVFEVGGEYFVNSFAQARAGVYLTVFDGRVRHGTVDEQRSASLAIGAHTIGILPSRRTST